MRTATLLTLAAALASVSAACGEAPACPDGYRADEAGRCVENPGDGGVPRDAGDAALPRDAALIPRDAITLPVDARPPVVDAGCPGIDEVCNDADDDCDGMVDEELPTVVWYHDLDGDGEGDRDNAAMRCGGGPTWVSNSTDCDDENDDRNSMATETCNGIDDDCDGERDESLTREFIRDEDDDGYGVSTVRIVACTPPAGYVDPEQSGDCDDSRADTFPGAAELCSARDEDCDSDVDETFACVLGATVACTTTCGSTGSGACVASTCTAPAAATCTPPAETCNGMDDDCDGILDDGLLSTGARTLFATGQQEISIVRTTDGYLVVFVEDDKLYARKLNTSGTPVGSNTLLHDPGVSILGMDAVSVSGAKVLTVFSTTTDIRGGVFDSATLSTSITPKKLVDASGVFEVSATPSPASEIVLVAYRALSGAILAVERATSSLTGAAAPFTLVADAEAGFDVAYDAARNRAYLAYADGTASANVQIADYSFASHLVERTLAVTADTTPQGYVTVAFGKNGAGASFLGVAWEHGLTDTASDRIHYVTVSIDPATGALAKINAPIEVETTPAVLLATTAGSPLEMTWTNERFYLAALRRSAGTRSTLVVNQLTPASGFERTYQLDRVGSIYSPYDSRAVGIAPGAMEDRKSVV